MTFFQNGTINSCTEENVVISYLFFIPKVGSVVEFKFTKVSPYDYSLPDFVFQADIPIEYTSFEIEIPEYYDYNLESQGYEALANKTEPTNMRFHIQYSDDNGRRQVFTDNCTATKRTFTGKNIPALKVEPYIWTTKDYITKISFELRSFQIKFGKLHQRSSSWAKIDNQLLDSKYFGGNTKKESLFKNDVTVGDITSANASTILSMVRSKAKWNKKNCLSPISKLVYDLIISHRRCCYGLLHQSIK